MSAFIVTDPKAVLDIICFKFLIIFGGTHEPEIMDRSEMVMFAFFGSFPFH